jgi:hypothetical protein
MAQHETQLAPVLFTDHDRHVVALSAYAGYYLGETSDFTMAAAAFSSDKVVLHTFKSADLYSGESATPAAVQQISLTAQEMDTLIECYQAYRNARQAQTAVSASSTPQGDPFLPDFPDD